LGIIRFISRTFDSCDIRLRWQQCQYQRTADVSSGDPYSAFKYYDWHLQPRSDSKSDVRVIL